MRYVVRGCAITDARSERLEHDQAVVVTDRTITWIGPDDAVAPPSDHLVIDGSGSTLVPAMVDSHSHVTLPGGAHWIGHIHDPAGQLLTVAERNGEALLRGGVRWARDVGSPRVVDPVQGRRGDWRRRGNITHPRVRAPTTSGSSRHQRSASTTR